MKFSDYLEYWNSESREGVKYLKDWHFYRDTKSYFSAYETPSYFCSDWLNEWWQFKHAADDQEENDYRFVYIGPKTSWTPLHSDVFGSFSWSANIAGKKKWIFLIPGEEDKLRDSLGNLSFDINLENMENHNAIEIIQESGEIVFVPSGWFHQVHNLEDTISINHNWFNGANVKKIAISLMTELR